MIFSGSEKSSQSVSTAKEAAMEQFEKKQYHKKQRGCVSVVMTGVLSVCRQAEIYILSVWNVF